MSDIYIGIVIMLLLNATSFALAYWLSKDSSAQRFYTMAGAVVGLFALYQLYLHDRGIMAALLPFSNLIIVGNWVPVFGAFVAGMALRRIPGDRQRKIIYALPLLGLSVYVVFAQLRGEIPEGNERFADGMILQSTLSSCGAACAATLLRANGIPASEVEMIHHCLTRERGTHWYGLYRGLKLKTERTGLRVKLLEGDINMLRALRQPAILSVRLDRQPGVDTYVREGWVPGVQHAVVLYGFAGDDELIIGDPAVGLDHWHLNDLALLWHGEAITLVKD
jgi:predicted double-glycine peptidase